MPTGPVVPSLTSGSRHQDITMGVGGAWVSGGASARGCAASASGSGVSRRRRAPRAAAPTARITSTEKIVTAPLSSIDRKSAQPTSAASTAASVEPSMRPVSRRFASLSSSPSKGTRSQAKP